MTNQDLFSIVVLPDGELHVYPGHAFTEEHVNLMVEAVGVVSDTLR